MTLQFIKATKEQAKLRLAIFGPAGSGKTYTGLAMATGMGGKIALIDTERGSATKYADRFSFDVLNLPKNDITTYCAAIKAAQGAGYEVLVIDSLSHGWKELLTEVDKIAKTKYRGNSWSAWSEGTPKQRSLVDAILNFDGHVIATMRTKTEWVTETNQKGKSRPIRVGLAPEQGKGIEYEFDLLMEISPEHVANIIKDRTGKFQDEIIEKPGVEFGQQLVAWLSEGVAQKAQPAPQTEPAPEPISEPVAEQKPATNGNGTKWPERPWPAETLKEYSAVKVANFSANVQDIGKQRIACMASVSNVTNNDDGKRRSIVAYLFGHDTSSKLTTAERGFLLDWIGSNQDNGFTPSGHAITEAEAVVVARAIEQGQGELGL